MVEGGAGPEFPVVFFDGEGEMNIGSICIYPMLEFKAFQLMLSQRIGISPNQISIYLCDRKISKFEDRRRVPITGKANFGLIAREEDNCFFLVVLKRSRKSRNRKAVEMKAEFGGDMPEDLILLRRNQSELNFWFGSLFYDQNLQFYDPNPGPDPFPRIQDTFPMVTKNSLMKCEQCKGNNGNGKFSGFHHCLNDPVIVGGFRTRFGPVGGSVNFY